MKHILFVCSANKDRSKSADDYFSQQFDDLEFKSAGTNQRICMQLGTQMIHEELLEWADVIIAMQEKHRKFINENFSGVDQKKIKVIHIQDRYGYYQKELIDLLKQKVEPLIMNYI